MTSKATLRKVRVTIQISTSSKRLEGLYEQLISMPTTRRSKYLRKLIEIAWTKEHEYGSATALERSREVADNAVRVRTAHNMGPDSADLLDSLRQFRKRHP